MNRGRLIALLLVLACEHRDEPTSAENVVCNCPEAEIPGLHHEAFPVDPESTRFGLARRPELDSLRASIVWEADDERIQVLLRLCGDEPDPDCNLTYSPGTNELGLLEPWDQSTLTVRYIEFGTAI